MAFPLKAFHASTTPGQKGNDSSITLAEELSATLSAEKLFRNQPG
ncbi:hypothetical protein SynBIOSU31_01257 [Synechococcus sp. BIOS-U3-1]|nr:hypothetical protein SynBIOSU31_01257 [Synechococcus sp. BIOS-U3-1]